MDKIFIEIPEVCTPLIGWPCVGGGSIELLGDSLPWTRTFTIISMVSALTFTGRNLSSLSQVG